MSICFLILCLQVKEKLTAEEYKNFVEFMKALKSKTMKISQVLQSIVGLFSGPERLPLLKRYLLLFNSNTLGDNCIRGSVLKLTWRWRVLGKIVNFSTDAYGCYYRWLILGTSDTDCNKTLLEPCYWYLRIDTLFTLSLVYYDFKMLLMWYGFLMFEPENATDAAPFVCCLLIAVFAVWNVPILSSSGIFSYIK